ncbi:MAG: hypothetical protein WKF80_10890 [Thermomicrobiales bacterium]
MGANQTVEGQTQSNSESGRGVRQRDHLDRRTTVWQEFATRRTPAFDSVIVLIPFGLFVVGFLLTIPNHEDPAGALKLIIEV